MSGALLVSNWVDDHYGVALDAAAPGVARVVLRPDACEGDPSSVEIAFFSGDFFPQRVREFVLALRDAKQLRWLHTFSAGVDNPWFQALRARGVRLTTSSGANAVPIAQTVMLYLHSPGNQVRAAEIFLDNLARFVRGEALRNEVA